MCYLYYMMQTDLQVPDLGEGADIMRLEHHQYLRNIIATVTEIQPHS